LLFRVASIVAVFVLTGGKGKVYALALVCCCIIGAQLRIIGLTGGIACGKSTVSNELTKHNWKIIDADKISREIMDTDQELQNLVFTNFGDEIVDLKEPNIKTIDRTKLGQIIFADP
jgi:dephospho-CoA kinase